MVSDNAISLPYRLASGKYKALGDVATVNMIFNAVALAIMAYAILILVASAIRESKHEKWHDKDGK